MKLSSRAQQASSDLSAPRGWGDAEDVSKGRKLIRIGGHERKNSAKEEEEEEEEGEAGVTLHPEERRIELEASAEAPLDTSPCTEEAHVDQRSPGGSELTSPAEEKPPEKLEACRETSAGETAAAKERALQRQQLAIEELVYTEKNYLQNLQVAAVTIRSNLQKLEPPLADLDTMFLHIEDVMAISARFLSLVEQKGVEPCDPLFLETLCVSFLSLSSDMEVAYREYLANYSQVIVVENGYKQKEALWSDIIKVIKASAPKVNATSLSFFLVMPVQRIARYPLLLQTIQKHSAPWHPAVALLQQAAHTAVALNCRINEFKRFREVADRYKKTEILSIKEKMNRLNSHSIAKKTSRLSQFIKHETGMTTKLVDEQFDALEGFYYVLESGILELHENVESYLLHLQTFLSCRPEECDLDLDGDKPAICFKEIHTALRQWILPTFEKRMRTLIHKPLCALRDLLVGPRNLIRKRLDKLLDYEVIENRTILSYEEQAVANTYRTINSLLLNELPQFNGLALQIICSTLGTFSVLHSDLASDMEQLFQGFAQQLPHSSLESDAFWEWAECAVLEGTNRMETVCRNVEETLTAPIVQPLTPSSQHRLKQLTQKHGSGKIYQVTGAVVGSRDLDLSLDRGELVAIITEADSRGDRRRWLVDAGGPRGYVPSSKLVRYHQATEAPPPSPHLILPGDMATRRHSYSPETIAMPASLPCFQVFSGFDFTARGSHEVSLRAGDAVTVLEPQDKRGNAEWSLVETRGGHRGYVPSNYLSVMAVATPYLQLAAGREWSSQPTSSYMARR